MVFQRATQQFGVSYGDCEECEFARNTNSVGDALAGARADAEQNGWTFDGDRHYCPEHRPVVIDANQMELLP